VESDDFGIIARNDCGHTLELDKRADPSGTFGRQ
jgi:hypothetical protein